MPRNLTKFIAPDLVNSQCTECSPVQAIGIIRPTEPDQRGALTIRHVYDAETGAELAARMHAWAREVLGGLRVATRACQKLERKGDGGVKRSTTVISYGSIRCKSVE
jgi:hypothetical protein